MRDAVQGAEGKQLSVFPVPEGEGPLCRPEARRSGNAVELQDVQHRSPELRRLISLIAVRQQAVLSSARPGAPRLDQEDAVPVVLIHPAFAQVHGGVQTARAHGAVDEVKPSQTSPAVMAVQSSCSPLALETNRNSVFSAETSLASHLKGSPVHH